MRYACDVCGERFFVHGHMKRHLYSHTGIKPHACRWKCGAIFASYGGRMKHERAQHSENPYKLDCDICGRPFRYRHLLHITAREYWQIYLMMTNRLLPDPKFASLFDFLKFSSGLSVS